MATLANLNVLIGADTRGFTKGLRDADRKTRSFASKGSQQMKMFGASAAAAASHVVSLRSAVAVAAGAAGLGLFVAKSASAAQETYNYARAVGTTAESLSSFGYAAQTEGYAPEHIEMAAEIVGHFLYALGFAPDKPKGPTLRLVDPTQPEG